MTRLLVLGANGKTGRLVVEVALSRGHQVRAFVRSPSVFPPHAALEIVQGQLLDSSSVGSALLGCEAVISALGSPGKQPTLSAAARVLLAQMQARAVSRLVWVSALGVGSSQDQLPQMGWVFQHLIYPLFLRETYVDKALQEQAIQASPLDWTLVRPSVLRDGPPTGEYQLGFDRSAQVRGSLKRADLAAALVTLAEKRERVGEAVAVSD
jgi:putative NADH-flavin reductase